MTRSHSPQEASHRKRHQRKRFSLRTGMKILRDEPIALAVLISFLDFRSGGPPTRLSEFQKFIRSQWAAKGRQP